MTTSFQPKEIFCFEAFADISNSRIFSMAWLIRCFVVFGLLFPLSGKAQERACNCLSVLDSVVRHLSTNYPAKETRKKWFEDGHLKPFREKATRIPDAKTCHSLLKIFLADFKDGHLGVSYSGDVFKPKKIKPQNRPEWPGLNEQRARAFLDSFPQKDSLTGIWESYESFYKALICKTKDGKGYRAYIIETINANWKPGEVKMEFLPDEKGKWVCTFFTSDHSPEQPDFTLNKNLLEIDKITVWNKLYPKTINPIPVESFVSSKYKWTQEFRAWDKETFYIQLQNLEPGVGPLIDSLVQMHKPAILKSRNLILDLRDNQGGDLTAFDPFWPLILDRPAVLYGTTWFCSPGNLESYDRQIESLDGQIDPEFQILAKEMRQHKGQFWTLPNDTLIPDTVFPYPEKVILLVNEQCKSSTEDFILTARTSGKVVVAGTSTGGVADLEETVDVGLPCPELVLFHPIGISNRLPQIPLDGIGIAPDWPLKSGSRAWQPWVREVVRRCRQSPTMKNFKNP
jgi:hypothetical protein